MTDNNPNEIKRIDGKYIIQEIKDEFLLDKGYLRTVKQILLYPSKTINEYLYQKRGAVVKPILFLIISVIIFTLSKFLIYNYSGTQNDTTDIYTDFILIGGTFTEIDGINPNYILNDYIEYTYIFFVIILSIIYKILFFKSKKNIYEIAVSLCYIIPIQLFIIIVFSIFTEIMILNELITFSVGRYRLDRVLSSFYAIWAISTCFDGKKSVKIIKSIFGYYLSFHIFFNLSLWLSYFLHNSKVFLFDN